MDRARRILILAAKAALLASACAVRNDSPTRFLSAAPAPPSALAHAALEPSPRPADDTPPPPPYDLAGDVTRRMDQAKDELGASAGAAVVEGVFVVAAPNARTPAALGGVVATTKTALAAYFNGRFSRRPAQAVSVYLFPNAAPYEAYCRHRWRHACSTIFGFYLGDERKIVMNLGPGVGTLTHELVHPIIETDFPDAPDWLSEGIASLYEGFALPGPGQIRGVKNWRYAGLIDALGSRERRELVRLDRLFGMTNQVFRGRDEGLNYALARYVCLWLETQNLLWTFYHEWRDHAATDPTGEQAFTAAVGMSPTEAAPRWNRWVRRL